jgi:protease I
MVRKLLFPRITPTEVVLVSLRKKRVALVVADRYADRQFWYPYYRLKEAGASVEIVGPNGDSYKGRHGIPVRAEQRLEAISPGDYDALILPGGDAAPMRTERPLVALVRSLLAGGGIVAAIGQGAHVLAAAGVVEGRRVTSDRRFRRDLERAGARWVEQEVVSDGNVITSRSSPDLPAFCRAITDTLV